MICLMSAAHHACRSVGTRIAVVSLEADAGSTACMQLGMPAACAHHAALAPCFFSSSSSQPDSQRKYILKSLMKDHRGYLKVAGLFFSMPK